MNASEKTILFNALTPTSTLFDLLSLIFCLAFNLATLLNLRPLKIYCKNESPNLLHYFEYRFSVEYTLKQKKKLVGLDTNYSIMAHEG